MQDDRASLKLLKDTFTIDQVSAEHRCIASYPWRRRYTTNYDNLLEVIDPSLESLNRDQLSFEIEKDAQLVHLNGSIHHLTNNSSLDDFQLTMSHYFDKDLFDTAWAATLRSDLELCDTIMFIGYSMYDIDISRIIYNDSALKNKTFVVQHTELPKHEERWLGNFGTVLKIGSAGISKIIESIQLEGGPTTNQAHVENFSEYEIKKDSGRKPAGLSDIAALLERGVFSRDIFEASW